MRPSFLRIQALFQQIDIMQKRMKRVQLNKRIPSYSKSKRLKAMNKILTAVSNHTRSLMEYEMSKGR